MAGLHRVLVGLCWVVAVTGLAPEVGAQPAGGLPPLADSIPADATIYLAFAGTDALQADYDQSKLKRVLDSGRVGELIRLALLDAAKQQTDEWTAELITMLPELIAEVARYPLAVYVRVEPPPNGAVPNNAVPVARIALVCRPGEQAVPAVRERLDALVNQALARANQSVSDAQYALSAHSLAGTLILATANVNQAHLARLAGGSADTIKGVKPVPSLAQDTQFQKTAAAVPNSPAVFAYVSGQLINEVMRAAIRSSVENPTPALPTTQPGAEKIQADSANAMALIDLIAFDSLALAGRFDQADWLGGWVLLASGSGSPFKSSEGFNGWLAEQPTGFASVQVFSFDLGPLSDAIDRIMALSDGKSLSEAYREGTAGGDLKAEVLDVLGSTWAVVGQPGIGAIVLCNQLKKPECGQRLIERILAAVSSDHMKARPMTLRGVRMQVLQTGFLQPAIAVHEDRLLISGNAQVLALYAASKPADGTMVDLPAYQALRDRVQPAAGLEFVSYVRLDKCFESVISLANLARLGGAQLEPQFLPEPLAAYMPTQVALRENLGPAASFMWSDKSGRYGRGLEPFPGASVVDVNGWVVPGPATFVVAAPVLLPALSRARETARQAVSGARLRHIALSLRVHAADHGDVYPMHLGELVLSDAVSTEQFVNPNSNTQLPKTLNADPAVDRLAAAATWVNANSDYVYLAAGRRASELDPATIILHEKPEHAVLGRVNVAFGDGSVREIPLDEFSELLAGQLGRAVEPMAE